MATFEDFEKLDVEVSKIIKVEDFLKTKKLFYKLTIDLRGDVGVKKSSDQLVDNYSKEDLVNKLILCVVSFPSLQIGPFMSEVLTLGIPDSKGKCVLIKPDKNVPLGARLY